MERILCSFFCFVNYFLFMFLFLKRGKINTKTNETTIAKGQCSRKDAREEMSMNRHNLSVNQLR